MENSWHAINCKVNLVQTGSINCIISNAAANQATTFAITYAKVYVPTVTSSTQDIQDYYNTWNQVLKEQLIRINVNQK